MGMNAVQTQTSSTNQLCSWEGEEGSKLNHTLLFSATQGYSF